MPAAPFRRRSGSFVLLALLSALCLGAFILLPSSFCLPSAAAAEAADAPPTLLPVSEVKAGMQGAVKTVFAGGAIESFQVEVTGVLKNWLGPGLDLILAKLTDPRVAQSGAVAGMSGSPLFIDGKLAGALSYRLQTFETEHYAGFTPIESMLAVGNFPPAPPRPALPFPTENSPGASQTQPPNPAVAEDDSAAALSAVPALGASAAVAAPVPASRPTVTPLATPLAIGGLSPRVFDLMADDFRRLGFMPLRGGGGSDARPFDAPFEPGSAVAGVLVTGDIDMAATGTVTYRKGDTIYGFGHPFLQTGNLALPMARAEIVTVLPSLENSFKLSNTRDVIGTITQDRLTAIEGKIGQMTPMIPVSVTARVGDDPARVYRCQVFQNAQMTSTLLRAVLMQASTGTLDYSQEFTAQVTGEVSFKGQPSLRVNEFYSGRSGEPLGAFLALPRQLDVLYNNPFEPLQIEKVDLAVRTTPVAQTYRIESLTLDRARVAPGGKVRAVVGLRGWQQNALRYEKLELTVPAEAKSGSLTLRVSDAASYRQPAVTPTSLGQYIAELNRAQPRHQLYARLETPTRGAAIQDQRLTSLPASVMQVIDSPRVKQDGTEDIRSEVIEEHRVAFDGLVRGDKSAEIEIE